MVKEATQTNIVVNKINEKDQYHNDKKLISIVSHIPETGDWTSFD